MKYIIVLSAALLGGCTPYNETFDCPPHRGVGCVALSQVNRMVDEGKLPLETQDQGAQEGEKTCPSSQQ